MVQEGGGEKLPRVALYRISMFIIDEGSLGITGDSTGDCQE